MSETIEAVYENGYFKPLNPVDWPEGTRVRVAPDIAALDLADRIRRQLLANGADPAEVERILDNLRLLWSSYESLTDEQRSEFEQARLDQKHFFDHSPQP